jgi:hypothetical protein
MIFNVPAVDDFCRVIRNGVTECGGPEAFFKNLTENTRITLRKAVSDTNSQQTLRRLLEDSSYEDILLNQISNEEDRAFIQALLQGWRIWNEAYPGKAEDIKILLIPALGILLDECPRLINDVVSCVSIIDLESFSETFMVKTVFKLATVNKEIGGPHAIVMSGRLAAFLETIRLMLNSIKLRETEVGLFKIPGGREAITSRILTELDQINQSVEVLRTQFENMKQRS